MPKHLEIQQPDFNLVLWHITEPLSFFELAMVNWADEYNTIKADDRKIQYAASRYVTSLLIKSNDASIIVKDKFRNPLLPNSDFKISISHDGNWAAVAIAKQQIGVDVFCMQARVLRIAHKFINADEKTLLASFILSDTDTIVYYSLLWSIKETVFKWMQMQNIDFKTDIVLVALNLDYAIIKTKTAAQVKVCFTIENEFCLCWIATQ